MSSQSTSTEKAKDTAVNAIQNVSDTVTGNSSDPRNQPGYDEDKDPRNFGKDAHGNVFKKGDFKDQLNRAATEPSTEKKEPEGLVGTIKSYIPGLAPKEEEKPVEEKETVAPGAAPARPDHDVQVEQFLRKQYHSKAGDGMPDPSKE